MTERLDRIGGLTREQDDPLMKASARTNMGRKRSVGDPSGVNLRDVWSIPTESFPGAHFATMPKGLAEPCIMASTSDHGVCSSCGAPWRRIKPRKGGSGRPSRWRPGCGCEAGRDPAIVLDPFGGAGTVGLVAHRLGRSAVLLEISEKYAQMARDRLFWDCPLLDPVRLERQSLDMAPAAASSGQPSVRSAAA